MFGTRSICILTLKSKIFTWTSTLSDVFYHKTHCNTLHLIATRCNTLQHTTTRCNIRHYLTSCITKQRNKRHVAPQNTVHYPENDICFGRGSSTGGTYPNVGGVRIAAVRSLYLTRYPPSLGLVLHLSHHGVQRAVLCSREGRRRVLPILRLPLE